MRGDVHPVLGVQLPVSSARLVRAAKWVRQIHGLIAGVQPAPYCRRDTTPHRTDVLVRTFRAYYVLCSSEGYTIFGGFGANMTMPQTLCAAGQPASGCFTRAPRLTTPCAYRSARTWLVREGVAGRGAGPVSGNACVLFR